MSADVHEDVRGLFIDCVNLARNDLSAEARAAIEASREDIQHVLAALATLVARRDRTKRWFTRTDAPGYLLRQVDGVEVRVPLHLFDDVPRDDVIDELLGLAAAIRTGGGTICLSGSCAVYGALHTVADCDFCEYLRGDPTETMRVAVEAAVNLSSNELVSLKVEGWGEQTWTVVRPWPTAVMADDRAGTTMTAHYFGRTAFAGDVEVTKVTILIGIDGDDERDSSFPAQEIPLAIDGWLPRGLAEPQEIAAYVIFLHGQVKKHEASNVAKALKRAFSLARILFLADEASAMATLFRETPLLIRAAAKARAEYVQRLATEYGNNVPPEVCARALASAVDLFHRCPGSATAEPATADAILTALATLPDSSAAAAGMVLERFMRSLDAILPRGVHWSGDIKPWRRVPKS